MAIVLFMLALLLSLSAMQNILLLSPHRCQARIPCFFLIEDGRTIKSQDHIPERHFCGQKFGESA